MASDDLGLETNTYSAPSGSPPVWMDATSDPRMMTKARLVIRDGSARQKVIVVDDRPLLIGRDANAQLHLTDRDVSRRHAIIERISTGAFVIRDLESSNGTRVNGSRVDEHVLSIGDRIHIGPELIIFTQFD